jgi:hypothetical protein
VGAGVRGGGAQAAEVFVIDEDCCGSSNPSADSKYSLLPRAATVVAQMWVANPEHSYHYTSGLAGIV